MHNQSINQSHCKATCLLFILAIVFILTELNVNSHFMHDLSIKTVFSKLLERSNLTHFDAVNETIESTQVLSTLNITDDVGDAKISVMNVSQENTSFIGINGSLYSNLRGDRSGSVVLDMMWAHAHALSMGHTYGGACGNSSHKQASHSLIELLGLTEELKLACPDPSDGTGARVMKPTEYRNKDFPEWWAYRMKESTRKTEWCKGPQKHEHKLVVHIRRGDVTPCHKLALGYSRYLPNCHYMALIEKYYQQDSSVTIFSEAKSAESFDEFKAKGYKVVLDGALMQVWKDAIDSDVFIISRSAFSYVPAILARGKVIYTEFWHSSLSTWEVVEDISILNETNYKLNSMRHNCGGKSQLL